MALTPIGDIASGGLTESAPTGTLTWETASDWNSAADAKSVAHAVYGDVADDSFFELNIPPAYAASGNAAPLCHYVMNESSGDLTDEVAGYTATANGSFTYDVAGVGSQTAIDFPGSNDYFVGGSGFNLSGNTSASSVIVAQSDTPNDGDWHAMIQFGAANGNSLWGPSKSADNEWAFNGFGGSPADWQTGTAADSDIHVHIITYDSGSGTLEWFIDGTSIGTHSNTYDWGSGDEEIGRRLDDRFYWDGWLQHGMVYDRVLTSTEIAYISGVISDGYLETATKSFSATSQPDLQNLSYSLNGESITLDVIGSPGTGSEEIVSQTLDGASSYTLSWSSSHTDFRIKANLDTTTPTTSPTVNRMELAT
jgi:hypothetical protein